MDPAPASVDRVLASPGRPLEPALRQDMEQRFGHDFSRVRVHSDAAAEQSARDVNANAYTVGHNVVFGAGRFAPGTHEGRRLIAHELTHVVQQSCASRFGVGPSDKKSGLKPVLVQRKQVNETMATSLELAPSTLTFEPTGIGKWSIRHVTLTNHGNKPVNVSQILGPVTVAEHPPSHFKRHFGDPSAPWPEAYDIERAETGPFETFYHRENNEIRPGATAQYQVNFSPTAAGHAQASFTWFDLNHPVIGDQRSLGTVLVSGDGKQPEKEPDKNAKAKRSDKNAKAKRPDNHVTPSGNPPADQPAVVLEAIAHILSVRNLRTDFPKPQDVGPAGEQISAPSYYTDVRMSIRDPAHVALLGEWYHLAIAHEPDGKGGQVAIEGSAARRRIARAAAETKSLVAAAGGSAARWAAVYQKGLDDLTAQAAREEVTTQIDVGMAHERLTGGEAVLKPEGEAEEAESLVRMAIDLNLESVEAAHKVSEHYGELIHESNVEAMHLYEERLKEYLRRVFKEHDLLADAPELPELVTRQSNFVAGMTFVKGGLDAALTILAVADPKRRAELFRSHSSFFGKVGGSAKITKVLLQFTSASLAFYGGATYSLARLAGNQRLADGVLELTVHRVNSVTTALNLVGVIHGAAVFLDPHASAEEKAEGAVETISGAVALAGQAGRWVPMLEEFAGWSGPIAAALSINLVVLKLTAEAAQQAKEGLASLFGSFYWEEAWQAAKEVQDWMRRLAVTRALLALETDEPRRKQLEAKAQGSHYALVSQQLKPYFEELYGAQGGQSDEGRGRTAGAAATRRSARRRREEF